MTDVDPVREQHLHRTELRIPLPNGNILACGESAGSYTLHGDYVRILSPTGEELTYWDSAEWAEDPVLVMGAIFHTALEGVPTGS